MWERQFYGSDILGASGGRQNEQLANVVTLLSGLLLIVVGISLTTAATALIETPSMQNGTLISPLNWLTAPDSFKKQILLSVVFFFFAIPFAHGIAAGISNEIEEAATREDRGRLVAIFDLWLLLPETIAFYALSLAVTSWAQFVAWLALVIAIDFIWIIISILTAPKASAPWKLQEGETPLKLWLILDLLMIGYFFYFYSLQPADNILNRFVLVAIALLRTCLDYWFGYSFYIPKGSRK